MLLFSGKALCLYPAHLGSSRLWDLGGKIAIGYSIYFPFVVLYKPT